MLVRRGDSIYAQAPHDSEAGSVHDREILIFPSDADLPRHFQVGSTHRLDNRYSAAQPLPKSFCSGRPNPVVQQSPGFDQNVD